MARGWPRPARLNGRRVRPWGGGAGPERAIGPRAARGAAAWPPPKVYLKLSLHRRPSSRIVLLRTGA